MSYLVDRRRNPVLVDQDVVTNQAITAEAFRLYVYLVSLCRDGGVAMPTQEELAVVFTADYSSQVTRVKHVRSALKVLVDTGLVIKERQTYKNLYTNNAYVIVDTYDRPPVETPARPAPTGVDPDWVIPLAYILWGHRNQAAIMSAHWRTIRAATRQLKEAGAQLDDLTSWYKQVWVKEWPGKDGQRPYLSQVVAGVAARLEQQQTKQPSSVVQIIPEED